MTTNSKADAFDRALSGKGSADPAVAGLVALAGALAAVPQRPAPAFRDALRTKLMAEAAAIAASVPAASVPATPAVRPPLRTLLQHPAMQVATGGLAAAVAATGVVVGTSRSLPGDPLYGLKRTVENWQVGLAGGATAEANALLEQAQTRLDEIRALLDQHALDRVTGAIDALQDELNSATSRLLNAARDGSREAYDTLQAAVVDLSRQLAALLPALPAGARAAASGVLATLNVARVQLAMIPKPPVVTPTPGVTVTTPTVSQTPTTVPTNVPTTPPTKLPTDLPTGIPTTPPTKLPTDLPTVTVPPVTPTLPPVTLPPL